MKTIFQSNPLVSTLAPLLTLILSFSLVEDCPAAARREVKIPDIPGYRTLKCDFHTHTVFSDGQVWPTVRVEEAWREGLDAIAITDHIEYKPHKQDVRPDTGKAYEIARAAGDEKGLIIIRGAEITRDMPPGHFNAIFLKDVKALDTNDWKDAMKNALSQGALIIWNHPGWEGQQPDGVPRWYPEHTEIYENGWMQGIEIVNENSYYPLAHKWALEKKLAIVGNSDIHDPICLGYDLCKGEHRPMTIVFAKESNEDAIKEALLARRTAIYYKNSIIGEEKYLRSIFEKSVRIPEAEVTIRGKGKAYIRIHNESEVDFELVANGSPEHIAAASNITLYGDRTALLTISGKQQGYSGTEKIRLPYKVKNLVVAPDENLRVELEITVNFVSVEPKTATSP
ncbi:MAG: Sb-PDE family phosphodiesterase [Sedimentisphaerales bacterium]|nr:Sb-PDE family phosphodiesterase [Sedimentisphaerales bacterium]